MINLIKTWIDTIWQKENRWMWYGLMAFGALCAIISWHMLPWAWFEAIMDPIIVAIMAAITIKRKIEECK